MTLTPEMNVCELLDRYPQLEEVFLRHGLPCRGCPGADNETVREAAAAHGVNVDKLMASLMKAVEQAE